MKTNSDSKVLQYAMYKFLDSNLPKVPTDIVDKLRLYCTQFGGINRNEIEEPYISEHQQAFKICRERKNKIHVILNYLYDLNERNNEMIACLRNSYKPPYDPESFIDAYYYDHMIKGQDVVNSEYWKVNKDKCEKAYNVWMEIFKKITCGTNAVVKFFSQFENRSKGSIHFYITGIIGEFCITFPQNILTDYGDRDELNDMYISICYSAPGKGNVVFKCLDYDLVCRSYDFDSLNSMFINRINDNCNTHEFKDIDFYKNKCAKDFTDFFLKYGYKDHNNMNQYEKMIITNFENEIKEKKCTVLETDEYKSHLNNIVNLVTKETYN